MLYVTLDPQHQFSHPISSLPRFFFLDLLKVFREKHANYILLFSGVKKWWFTHGYKNKKSKYPWVITIQVLVGKMVIHPSLTQIPMFLFQRNRYRLCSSVISSPKRKSKTLALGIFAFFRDRAWDLDLPKGCQGKTLRPVFGDGESKTALLFSQPFKANPWKVLVYRMAFVWKKFHLWNLPETNIAFEN